MRTLLEMDCIPAGMELFPAVDEEQYEFIKKIIDDSDYYLLIIGGRYGSLTPEGISYTEKEYDYAVEKGIPVIALLHDKPKEIPYGKSEGDPELRNKLEKFKEKVSKGRLVKPWKSADELPGLVAVSLNKSIKTYPQKGWVRPDSLANIEALTELNEIRKQNDILQEQLNKYKDLSNPRIKRLAPMDNKFTINFSVRKRSIGTVNEEIQLSWNEIFYLIGPKLFETTNEDALKDYLTDLIFEEYKKEYGYDSLSIKDADFQTIKIQLAALGLITIRELQTRAGTYALFWNLTQIGTRHLYEIRTIKDK